MKRSLKMNDTENYLAHVKSELWKRLLRSFLCFFAGFFVCLALSYAVFKTADCGRYFVAANVSGGGIFDGIKSTVVSLVPCALEMLVLYFSAYSSLCPIISALLCSFRGASLGALAGLISKNTLGGIGSHSNVAAWLYFAATAVFIALASMSALYSGVLTYTFSRDEKLYYRALSAEYTKCFLICSGAVFIISCAQTVFIAL